MKKIGYLGPKGTFSQEAAIKYISLTEKAQALDMNSIPEILIGVEKGILDEGVVPVESSLEGGVNSTLDMLSSEADIKIKAELVIPIEQNLLVKKNSSKDSIKVILSHPQPLGQCRRYIAESFPTVHLSISYSTAAAAMEVAQSNGEIAAIASLTAAKEYGLDVIDRAIQDSEASVTRFLVVARSFSSLTGNDKTSIVFSTDNKPGSLFHILEIFNLWDINMTRIESRPAKNELGKYVFFIDIQGHIDNQDVEDALKMVKRKTSFYKFLGSYPCYNN